LGALVGVIALACLPFATTAGSYRDAEYGNVDLAVESSQPKPVDGLQVNDRHSYLAQTMVALSTSGQAAYVWGNRGFGLSGTGQQTVASDSDFSVVKLPNGKKMNQIVGGSSRGTSPGGHAAIAVLAEDGSVWTWGDAAPDRLGRPVTSKNNAQPVKVTFPGQVVVSDLRSGGSFFAALTTEGELYTFGPPHQHGSKSSFGDLGQGALAYGTAPRLILTKVHSFGVGVLNGWAVVAPGWQSYTYPGGVDRPSAGPSKPGDAGEVLFWGYNSEIHGGAASGDPSLVRDSYAVPTRLASDARLNVLLRKGTAAGDDNVSPGRVMGGPDDKGTFRHMTGNTYGNQVLLRDGTLWAWGTSTFSGSGSSDTMLKRAAMVPTKVWLDNRKVKAVAHTWRLTFLLDETNTVWIYGQAGQGEAGVFPSASGLPPIRLSNRPVRIDGGSSPGWKAGGITAIASCGGMTAILKRDDTTTWLVGGSLLETKTNAMSLVRNSWSKAGNTTPVNAYQPITKIDLTGLPG
jgi:hypothetical protein